MTKTVYYLSPSSFCFGVKRSIDQLNDIIKQHQGENIVCVHALVHNPKVTKEFEQKGIVFVESIQEITNPNTIVIFSAHGTKRSLIKKAQATYKKVYNLECPFVSKIYTEVDNFLQQWIHSFVYIGKESHQEGQNVIEHIRENWGDVVVIQQEQEISILPFTHHDTFAVISQTTLNFEKVTNTLKNIQQIYPWAHIPWFSDVCRATYERQTVILKHIHFFDALIVIWGKESNNTKELYNLWITNNKTTWFGESLEDILAYGEQTILQYDRIAITWWASTPVEDIRAVFDYYKSKNYEPKILTLQ